MSEGIGVQLQWEREAEFRFNRSTLGCHPSPENEDHNTPG